MDEAPPPTLPPLPLRQQLLSQGVRRTSDMREVALPPMPECLVRNREGSGRSVRREVANTFTSTSPVKGSWRPGASMADDRTEVLEKAVPVSACLTWGPGGRGRRSKAGGGGWGVGARENKGLRGEAGGNPIPTTPPPPDVAGPPTAQTHATHPASPS
jgi:hypothetical protein